MMSSHSLEKADDKPESFEGVELGFIGDDKPEPDRDPIPHYYKPMAIPDRTFFYTSREGRFVFPFEDSEKERLVSLDEGIDATLPPWADKLEAIAKRVWREFFTALRIGFVFIFIFIIELTRFIAHDIIHSFVLRVLAVLGDFLIKPLLVLVYNSFIQPIFVFVWNVLVALSHMLEPAASIVRQFAIQIALILKAFRLVEVNLGKPWYEKESVISKVEDV